MLENSDNKIYKYYIDLNPIPKPAGDVFIWVAKWLRYDGDFVKQNVPLILLSRTFKDKFYDIKSPCDGYLEKIKADHYEPILDSHDQHIIKDKELLFIIHKQIDLETKNRLIEKRFKSIPQIRNDLFVNKKEIKWQSVCGRVNNNEVLGEYFDSLISYSEATLSLRNMLMFTLNNIEAKDFIIFRYSTRDYKLSIGDQILFLFENDILLKFQITNKPFKLEKTPIYGQVYKTVIQLTKNDLDIFENKNFLGWQIQFLDSDKKITMGEGVEPYLEIKDFQNAFKIFIKDYKKIVLQEITDYKPLIINQTFEKPITKNNEEECYLYLMIDYNNNYHKIGISNKPEYREKTLQSEKPTIELICNKKFPSRKIAMIFEKTLHKTYSQKRIRGEWFNLDENDVEEIKVTLA